jgi:hypothetical protein
MNIARWHRFSAPTGQGSSRESAASRECARHQPQHEPNLLQHDSYDLTTCLKAAARPLPATAALAVAAELAKLRTAHWRGAGKRQPCVIGKAPSLAPRMTVTLRYGGWLRASAQPYVSVPGLLRREHCNDRVIRMDLALAGRTARRAEVGKNSTLTLW